MSKIMAMNVLLSKVAADQKEAFIAEIREAKEKKDRIAIIKKYCGELTEAEKEAIEKARGGEVSDEEMDNAAGGCHCMCSNCHGCYCGCG